MELAGQVALVTGASKGIGRAIALELARAGADLAINARGREALEAVAGEVRACGRQVETVAADVATEADWQASFALNFMSAVRLSLACVPIMRAQCGGRIVNIASRVGRQPDPLFAPYAAAKAALINFTKSLANAFSKDGILSNCVVPGLIRTEAVEEAARASAAATGRTVEEVLAETLRRRPIPAGRMGEPADVAGLVVFLASPHASWITGGTFSVDGGILPVAP